MSERPRDEVLRTANLEIEPPSTSLLADGKRVGLTVREFQTFLVLAERPDRVVTRPEIYSLVWGRQMTYRDRSVDVFVRKLRRKLEAALPVGPTSTRISDRVPVPARARHGVPGIKRTLTVGREPLVR